MKEYVTPEMKIVAFPLIDVIALSEVGGVADYGENVYNIGSDFWG